MNEVVITDAELITAVWGINSRQTILGLLKEKGAPIQGNFWLDIKPGFIWTSWRDVVHNSYIFKWSKI